MSTYCVRRCVNTRGFIRHRFLDGKIARRRDRALSVGLLHLSLSSLSFSLSFSLPLSSSLLFLSLFRSRAPNSRNPRLLLRHRELSCPPRLRIIVLPLFRHPCRDRFRIYRGDSRAVVEKGWLARGGNGAARREGRCVARGKTSQ